MSVDYRFIVKRKIDNKTIGEFYYNKIKNVSDVSYLIELKCDPKTFSKSIDTNNNSAKIDPESLNDDITKLRSYVDSQYKEIFTKQLIQATCTNSTIKEEYDDDIREINERIDNSLWALEALAGLYAIVTCLVEDLVIKIKHEDSTDECECAYKHNAKDLGDNKYLWINDVYIEAIPEW